ncbi:MAG: dephospho-CoA kinase [Chloroflexota bacterium]
MPKKPLIIGLTGNIGSGKSTVLAYFAQLPNVSILDADRLAHQAMSPGGPAFDEIVGRFGKSILKPDGLIDRQALGKVVFSDAQALQDLEKISHPAVLRLAEEAIQKAADQGDKLVILEAIKLLDGGQTVQLCDEVWVVTIDTESQLQRLSEQRGMDEESVQQRLAAQSSQEYKVQKADRVIENSGSLKELEQQLADLWAALNL